MCQVRTATTQAQEHTHAYKSNLNPFSLPLTLTKWRPNATVNATRKSIAYYSCCSSCFCVENEEEDGVQSQKGFGFETYFAVDSAVVNLRASETPDNWKNIAEEFMQLWNFPHCIGAIDGKHIECPKNSSSLYCNYKGFFSIVLLGICDAHYIFNYIDVGDFGSNNDSGVLENSAIGKAFATNHIGIPDPEPVEGCKIPLPYYLVGDDIFAQKTSLMRSFPGRSQLSEDQQIFNYRLSRHVGS